jgi:hypothetical protein
LQQQYDAYVAQLVAIVAGSVKLPQQSESFDVMPGVSNFAISLVEPHRKAQVVDETSV